MPELDEVPSLLERYCAARERGGDSPSVVSLLIAGSAITPLDNALLMLFVRNRWAGVRWWMPDWVRRVRREAKRRKWQVAESDYRGLATLALRHWVFNVCTECKGRRFDLILTTPSLSATPCGKCKGLGWMRHRDTRIEDLACLLDERVRAARGVLASRYYGELRPLDEMQLQSPPDDEYNRAQSPSIASQFG